MGQVPQKCGLFSFKNGIRLYDRLNLCTMVLGEGLALSNGGAA